MRNGKPLMKFAIRDIVAILLLAGLLLSLSSIAQTPEVQAFGDNRFQQNSVPSPLTGVLSIAGGLGHSMVLKTDGTVKVWGFLLANNNTVTDVTAIAAGGLHGVALKADGTVVAWGSNTSGQLNMPSGLTNVKAIAAANNHTLALRDDGTVVAWGDNGFGQLNIPVGLSDVVSISAGAIFSLALKADGTVIKWGTIASVPSTLTNVIAIDGGGTHALALKADGTVVAWGDNTYGQSTVPVGLSNVIAISAGMDHSVALKADGTVVAWGRNNFNQTSIPPGLANVVEIYAGENHTVVRRGDNFRVRYWGSNNLSDPPFDLSGAKRASGGASTSGATKQGVVLKCDGSVVAWGTGAASTVPNGLSNVKEIVSGYEHVVALKADGTLVAWGNNSGAQLNIPNGLTNVKSIAVGAHHTLALKSDGTVIGFGFNSGGMINIPVGLTNVIEVAAGPFHSIALKSDGTVVGWGQDNSSQIDFRSDLNTVKAIGAGQATSVVLKSDGTIEYTGGNTHGQKNTPANIFPLRSIVSGQLHHLALRSNGTPVIWGFDNRSNNPIVPAGIDAVQSISRAFANGGSGSIAIVTDHAPVVANVASPVTYIENASAQLLQSTITVADNGQTSLMGATVSITGGFLTGDMLAVTTPSGLVQNYNAGTGMLTITGTQTVDNFQTMLRSLTYYSTSQTPAVNSTRTITFTVTDGTNTSDAAVFTVNISAVNDAPSFTKGADVIRNEDVGAQTVNSWATSISKGPADESGQALTFIVTNDNNGLFSSQPAISSSGMLTFTPAPNKSGIATVTVILSDDGGTANGGVDQSAAQTFTITINDINDAPTFNLVGTLVSFEDFPIPPISNFATAITAGTPDEAAQTLTFTVTNDNNSLFSVQPQLSSSGILTFTLKPDAYGTVRLTVVLSDNGGTANGGIDRTQKTSNFTFHSVNDAPSFTKGSDVSILEGAGAQAIAGWATNMSPGPANEAAQTLSFSVSNNNTSLFSAQPSLNAAGDLTFTPAPDAFGVATVTVTLTDNGGTNLDGVNSQTQTFVITINNINDAPTFNLVGSLVTFEDAVIPVIANFANAISAGTPEEVAQTLTFTVTNDNNSLFSVQPQINSSGALTFSLAPDAYGTANITVILSDNGGTANGGVDRTQKTSTIIVNSVNDVPSFTKGSDVSILEDAGAQTIAGWATNMSPGPVNESAQTLSFSVSNNNTSLFSVQPALNAAGTLTFTPAPDASGEATVTVTLIDNGGTLFHGVDRTSQTFIITINDVNDAPTFTTGTTVVVWEDATPTLGGSWLNNPLPGPANEAGQTLTVQTDNNNNSLFAVQPTVDLAGQLSFTLAPDANGSAIITVRLIDDGGTANGGVDRSQATFTIIVQDVNDAPSFIKGYDVVVNEDATAQHINSWASGIAAGPADESGQTLSFQLSNDNNSLFSVQPSINVSGDLIFTVSHNVSGTATVTVYLQDNGGTAGSGVDRSSDQTFTITVNAVNDVPSFTKGGDISINEDAGPQIQNAWASAISAGPADESAQAVSFLVSNDNPGLFSVQPAVSASGELTFIPAPDAVGLATITISLQDDGGIDHGGIDQSANQTFTITINGVNDAPSFAKGNDVTVIEDAGAQTINGWASAISAGPVDEASQTLNFQVSNDNNALFTVQPSLNAFGDLTFTVKPNVSGVATVAMSLHDNGGTANGGIDQSADQSFTITVNAVNDAPSFTKGTDVVVNEDAGAQNIIGWATNISPGPADENSQALTFTVNNDNNGLFSVQPAVDVSGKLTFTPAAGVSGSTTVILSLQDNGGTAHGGIDQSAVQSFTIAINDVNDAPSFIKGSDVEVNEDAGMQTIAAWASHISPGAGELTQHVNFEVSNDNSSLFSTQPFINEHGDLTFTPAADFSGIATVTLSLHDDGGVANGGIDHTTDQVFTITILPVNDAPSFTKGSDIEINEGDPAQVFPGWARDIVAGAQETFQTLDFEISNDSPILFSAQPEVNANGDLTFTPSPHAYGIAIVTLTLHDNGGTSRGGADRSAVQSFTITINGINDAPVFSKGQDIIVDEDAQPYHNAWATGIDAGDPGQLVAFLVSADNKNLFAIQPSINASGVLSFELKPDAFGSTTVSVQLKDNGGTARGGVDQSIVQNFLITINPVNDAPHIDPVDDMIVPVNSEPIVINLTGIHPGSGEDDQQITLEVTSDDHAILPDPQLTALQNGLATLTLYPAAGRTGNVVVTIKVSDNGGTTSRGKDETTISFLLTVEQEIQAVFLPNFFSPNSNGMNDVFRVRGAGIEQIQFRIFDVNGQELFSTTDVTEATDTGWNGTYQGKEQPAGIYTWTLQGKYTDGTSVTNRHNQYGQVILVR